MLSGIRKQAGGWLTQIFLGILVISFAIWGVSDIFRGFRGGEIARVGDTEITAPMFQQQFKQVINQANRQFGQNLTPAQAQQLGLPSQALSQLVSQATLDDMAKRMKLGISNQELAKQIAADETFKGPSGTFDRDYFTQVLRANDLDENHYVESRRRDEVRQQITQSLVGGAAAPEAYVQAFQEYNGEERSVSYLILPLSVAGTIPEPTADELTKYFEANKANWKAPEYRALSVVKLTPADIAKPDEITDEEAKKIYDANVASYTTPEQRKISQIVFSDQADADKATASLAAGQSFDDLAMQRNLKPADTDLGLVTRDHFADMTVAEAAFTLTAGAVSPVIDGQFGPVILRVDEIKPQVIKSFDEVKGDIKKDIATKKAADEINSQHDMIEDQRASGSTLAEAAEKYGLKVVTIPAIDQNGNGEDGKPVADVPGGAELIAAAYQSDVGLENDPVPIDNRTGYVWYEVTAVTQARERQLDEIRDRVVADWKTKATADKVLAKANEVRDRLAKGEDIAKIATELGGLEVKTADKLVRSTPASNDLPAAAVAAAFSGPKGTAVVSPGTDAGTQVVMVVTGNEVPAYTAGSPDTVQVGKQVGLMIANDLMTQYISVTSNDLGVSINQPVIQQLLSVQPES